MDLIRAYSNPDPRLATGVAACLAMTPGWVESDRSVGTPTKRAHKLRPHEIDELVAAYQAGASAKELGERFKLNKKTIGRHLRARGIQTVPPGLEDADLSAAVRLYRDGWSLARILARRPSKHTFHPPAGTQERPVLPTSTSMVFRLNQPRRPNSGNGTRS